MSSTLHSLFGLELLQPRGKYVTETQLQTVPSISVGPLEQLRQFQWFIDLTLVFGQALTFDLELGDDIHVSENKLILPAQVLTAEQKKHLWKQVQAYV
ncbi:hypothetical protein NI389_06335 [Pseudoalteromonas xiamenensis]|uniref:hypothetical protein n=1 Tax=Pseudoalteromonas xiamenensis TaxID=882626 RepID=UPI0027E3B7F8|nr:hypothetical protein [Pseudoalteromonas xiamenensis]WMN61008.1 hypothetical protein NI389_06335 [Pseudoalteromonas xiamenensis]